MWCLDLHHYLHHTPHLTHHGLHKHFLISQFCIIFGNALTTILSHDCCKTKVRKNNNKIKDLTNHSLTCLHSRIWITLHSCFTQNNMALTLRCSHHSCLFSLDNSLLVLLKLHKQLKISSNNSPRTNQGISDLNIRNMEFFSLELEGVW
jgi:hypothetical protein